LNIEDLSLYPHDSTDHTLLCKAEFSIYCCRAKAQTVRAGTLTSKMPFLAALARNQQQRMNSSLEIEEKHANYIRQKMHTVPLFIFAIYVTGLTNLGAKSVKSFGKLGRISTFVFLSILYRRSRVTHFIFLYTKYADKIGKL